MEPESGMTNDAINLANNVTAAQKATSADKKASSISPTNALNKSLKYNPIMSRVYDEGFNTQKGKKNENEKEKKNKVFDVAKKKNDLSKFDVDMTKTWNDHAGQNVATLLRKVFAYNEPTRRDNEQYDYNGSGPKTFTKNINFAHYERKPKLGL